MDLIYTNASKEDIGVLLDYEMDMAFGADENTFECNVTSNNHCCEAGSLLYMEGTEYGGIVDSIESKSSTKEVVYSGRTWHGILNSKILEPDPGADYLYCYGEANSVIGELLERIGLTNLFTVSGESSGLWINNYKMNRYIEAYDGIRKMLASVNGKLLFRCEDGMIVLSAVPAVDYTQDEEFNSDLVDFDVKKSYRTVNHLICLGTGELSNRTVVHLYADSSGNISHAQTQMGMDEFTAVFDYPNAESEELLIAEGTEKLKQLWEPDKLSIDFDDTTDAYHVGDKVGAVDNITGISVSAAITKKIVTIKNGQITISYKVGE